MSLDMVEVLGRIWQPEENSVDHDARPMQASRSMCATLDVSVSVSV